MKNRITNLKIIIVLSALVLLNAEDGNKTNSKQLTKPTIRSANNFDGNRIDCDMENNGMFVSQNINGRSGLTWPKGNGTQTIYASGIWLGGLINNEVRVSAAEFAGEFASGPLDADHLDPIHKIYKVNKGDLANPQDFDDFQNWPVEFGAPWIDNNNNDIYEPLPEGPDHPDFIGDQVLWMVMNDGVDTFHSLFHTSPMGVELQRTVFGFDRLDLFGDIMFIKDLIINKGNTTIKDMYIGLWSDPDLGDASDDFVGCDTTLGMGIVFNDGPDANYAGFEQGVPAAGFDFFQGPMITAPGETAHMFNRYIPDMKNLQMTSFINVTKWGHGFGIPADPNDAIEAYNLMKGLNNDGTKMDEKYSGGSTFMHPSDPTMNVDHLDNILVDGDWWSSDDRRMLLSSGPFIIMPGDSQEVVYGIINAADGDWNDSYLKLKEVDKIAQRAVDAHFIPGELPPQPDIRTTELSDQIILTWDYIAESYESTNPFSINPETGELPIYQFEGYNVYQSDNQEGSGELVKLATFDIINGVTKIEDDVFLDEFGKYVNIYVQHGSDSGLQNSIQITKDALNDFNDLITNREYYFTVTAYGYNPHAIPKTLESEKSFIAIRPQNNTTWESIDDTVQYGNTFIAEHTQGISTGVAKYKIIDPTKITGDEYEIFFADHEYYRDADGIWHNTDANLKESLSKIMDCSGSIITVAALASADLGTYDLKFNLDMDCGRNYIDGLELRFPPDIIINSWDKLGDLSYSNRDGTYYPTVNSIIWGHKSNPYTYASISKSTTFTVNIEPTDFPINIEFEIWDDGYDDSQVNAKGIATATELGFEYKTIFGWYVRNLSTGEIVTDFSIIFNGSSEENIIEGKLNNEQNVGTNANPIVDGIQITVDKSIRGFGNIQEIAYGGIVLDEPVNVWQNPNSNGTYYLNTWGTWRGLDGNIEYSEPRDFELRFTEGPNYGIHGYYYERKFIMSVPFEIWDIGIATPDNPIDDKRMLPSISSADFNQSVFSYLGQNSDYSMGYPASNFIKAWDLIDINGYDNFASDAIAVGGAGRYLPENYDFGIDYHGRGFAPIYRLIFGDINLQGQGIPSGTVIRLSTNKPIDLDDKYLISTASLKGENVNYKSNSINVWPNPYFAYNPEETSANDRQIHFTNLPFEGKCIIRIFDLTGTLVRKLDHTNGTQFEIWDVRDYHSNPVVSGMYIIHIETEVGNKILKLAVIQQQS